MGAKAPIFTRSLWSFRSFSWGDHSDHSAGGFAQIIICLRFHVKSAAGRCQPSTLDTY